MPMWGRSVATHATWRESEANMSATYQTLTSTTPVSGTADSLGNQADRLLENARALGPLVRQHAEDAERTRRLSKPVRDALIAAGLQRMLAPRSLGGFETDPVTCARVVEQVASYDAAAGWALQTNLGGWWASRLPQRGAEELYGSNPSLAMAAAFHPPQQAVEVSGGYRVTGRSPLASGVHDSECVMLSAMVMDGDRPRMTEVGPVMVAFVVPTSDTEIIDTWHTLGMRGTDSNDIAVNDVFIPAHRTFPLDPHLPPNPHF